VRTRRHAPGLPGTRRLPRTLACLKAPCLILALLVPLLALAQLSPQTREIYRKDADHLLALALSKKLPNAMPGRGAVRSAAAAVKLHEVTAGTVFGAAHVAQQKPFFAIRSGEYWVVYGTVPGGELGGTAVTVIRANDGGVLGVVHQR